MLGPIKTMDNFDFKGKSVIIRADLNVPYKDGVLNDTTRVDQFLPTLQELVKKGASSIHILSHLGRPDGQANPDYSLAFLAPYLAQKLQQPVIFVTDCLEKNPTNHGIFLYENVRFYEEEEKNDADFAKKLADHGDIFLNDAFSCAHRAHASVVAITQYLPHGVGRLMEQELRMLNTVLGHPQHPVMAIVGGSKVSTKLDLLENLINKVDYLVIGGAMANTFLAAQEKNIGASLYESHMLPQAKEILQKATQQLCDIILPIDVVVGQDLNNPKTARECYLDDIHAHEKIFDLGLQTLGVIDKFLQQTKTLVWNGPVGVFEHPPFDQGTNDLARKIAHYTRQGLVSVAGGGDTAAALNHAGVSDQLSYLSLAGGAFLEWLEGKELPGVKVLS